MEFIYFYINLNKLNFLYKIIIKLRANSSEFCGFDIKN